MGQPLIGKEAAKWLAIGVMGYAAITHGYGGLLFIIFLIAMC